MSTRLASIFAASPHLSELAIKVHGDLPREASALEGTTEVLAQAIAQLAGADCADEAAIMTLLRQAKHRVTLSTALADRLGRSSVDETTGRLSAFADAAIALGVRCAFAIEGQGGKWTGDPSAIRGYTVLGMGKLGAGELNYSSDVDLIILFDDEGLETDLQQTVEPGPFAVRVTRRLVRLLQDHTSDGYVFRTDLRLRPDPASTPLALSLEGALNYYESQGRTWERAAMIKARPLAGDLALGQHFTQALQPFIWRRHLDYAAIDAIRAIKRRINAHKGFGAITVPGHDVKLGRGGIREIEFFAQTQQLIAGGRNAALRQVRTKQALAGLCAAGWIGQDERDVLCAAYDHLRNVEHCIQMVRDEQTHRLPQDNSERAGIAALMDEDLEAFDSKVQASLEAVHSRFKALFPDDEQEDAQALDPFSQEMSQKLHDHIAQLGYEKPGEVHRLLAGWMKGTMNATASSAARERLHALGPRLLRVFGRTDRPDAALRALDSFFKGLPGGKQFFSMLASNPSIIELLARIMGTAPRLADMLARRPRLFDALLDPRFFGSLPSRDAIRSDLERAVSQAPSFESKLNASRIIGQEHHFLIGVRLLSQTLTAREAAAAYTALAEETILTLLDVAHADIRVAHGGFEDASLCVLAMGKLGSGELTASSDLDILLIYDLPDEDMPSDGARPLAAAHYFTRLTQRLISALSAPTAEGMLYELDMRLRPSGRAGPLATSLKAFERYQRTQARTWEHMALTRARPLGREPKGCAALSMVIAGILTSRFDPAIIRADVVAMRTLIERSKPACGPFDMKLAPGGIIDVEFVAQGLQLCHAQDDSTILHASTLDSLRALQAGGFLSPDDGAALVAAHRLYGTLSQIVRLCVDGVFDPSTAAPSLRRMMADACDLPGIETVATHLEQTQADIRERFIALFEGLDTGVQPDPSGATHSKETNDAK